VTTLLKRFQLPVYFQLRLKEAVVLIERAFEMGSASGGGAKDATFASSSSAAAGEDVEEGFVMSESEAVWKALERCWDDDVWLVELAGRFWKLALQVSLFAWLPRLWLSHDNALAPDIPSAIRVAFFEETDATIFLSLSLTCHADPEPIPDLVERQGTALRSADECFFGESSCGR
jgi:hypothetical protein